MEKYKGKKKGEGREAFMEGNIDALRPRCRRWTTPYKGEEGGIVISALLDLYSDPIFRGLWHIAKRH